MDVRIRVNRPKATEEIIDGEVLIINLDTGSYYSLVKTGAEVWQGIVQNLSKHQLVEQIVQCYDEQREMVENSIDTFLQELEREELIVLEQINGNDDNSDMPLRKTANGEVERKLKFEPPVLEKYTDMSDLLLMDPIHEVDESGWPNRKPTF